MSQVQTDAPIKSHILSLVIPLYNEEDNIEEIYRGIVDVMKSMPYHYEIIFVNDGSTDKSQLVLEFLHYYDERHVKVISFNKNVGKASALREGFSIAHGDIVLTLDGDLQDDPREIPRFIEKIDEGYDVVSGWKNPRVDSLIKNSTSKIYNLFTSIFSGIHLHDHNSGFKAYKREVAQSLPLDGQLHRYIPLLAAHNGYRQITEITVNHRKRSNGISKYGMSRFFYGAYGLLYILVITDPLLKRFSSLTKKPESYRAKNILT